MARFSRWLIDRFRRFVGVNLLLRFVNYQRTRAGMSSVTTQNMGHRGGFIARAHFGFAESIVGFQPQRGALFEGAPQSQAAIRHHGHGITVAIMTVPQEEEVRALQRTLFYAGAIDSDYLSLGKRGEERDQRNSAAAFVELADGSSGQNSVYRDLAARWPVDQLVATVISFQKPLLSERLQILRYRVRRPITEVVNDLAIRWPYLAAINLLAQVLKKSVLLSG